MEKHLWISGIKANHDLAWYDYNLSIPNYVDGRFLAKYRDIPYGEKNPDQKEIFKKENHEYVNFLKLYEKANVTIPADRLPDRIYKKVDEKLECERSIFMVVGSFIFINEATAELLTQFHLGKSQLIKVIPYDYVTDTPIEDGCPLYLLNIAEGHEYCRLEESENVHMTKILGKVRPRNSLEPVEDGYIIDPAILETGLDLWVDPRLTRGIYISDGLKQALDQAGVADQWLLTRCVIK